MLKILTFIIAFTSFLTFSGFTLVPSTPVLTLQTWTTDIEKLCPGVNSVWNYSEEDTSPSLLLAKPCTTYTNALAGGTVLGMDNQRLTALGFDVKSTEHCGPASPRFTVYTAKGVYYFFGCQSGTHKDLKNDWTRIEFSNKDAKPVNGAQAWPGFGKVTVTALELAFDEHGTTQVDNLKINNQVITGPTKDQQVESCKNDGWLNYSYLGPFTSQQDCIDYFSKQN